MDLIGPGPSLSTMGPGVTVLLVSLEPSKELSEPIHGFLDFFVLHFLDEAGGYLPEELVHHFRLPNHFPGH